MLKKRLNEDDNIASELLDNIFIQVNSMSDLVNKLDYVTNINSNTPIDDTDIYIDNKNMIDDSNVSDVIKDDNAILVVNDIEDEIWVPAKDEIDIIIDDDINNDNGKK